MFRKSILCFLILVIGLTGCQSDKHSSEKQKTPSDLQSDPVIQSTTLETTQEDLLADLIDDDLPIEPVDYSQFDSVDSLIEQIIQDFGYNQTNLGIVYHNLVTEEDYTLNENMPIFGASTNKVGTCLIIADLINQGNLTWDTYVPAYSSLYEEGDGDITNSPLKDWYTVEDLVYNMLVYSDNTAWNILAVYYINHYGSHQEGLIRISGIQDIPQDLYQSNFACPSMLDGYLQKIVQNPTAYHKLSDYMLMSEPGLRFKQYVPEGMASKYGQYDDAYHDIGIYYEEGVPLYTLVLMSKNYSVFDEFMATLNYHLKIWTKYQQIKDADHSLE